MEGNRAYASINPDILQLLHAFPPHAARRLAAQCGAGSKMPTFVSGLDQALDATSITVVENLFDRLVGKCTQRVPW